MRPPHEVWNEEIERAEHEKETAAKKRRERVIMWAIIVTAVATVFYAIVAYFK